MSNKQKRISEVRKNMAKHERRKLTTKARKLTKKKHKVKHVRRKDWQDGGDEMSLIPDERIMPRGENERRREVEKITSRKPMQNNEQDIVSTPSSKEREGLVTEVGSGNCKVFIDNEILVCSLRGAFKAHETGYTNVVAVGDVALVNVENAVVEAILPRRSLLTRPDVSYSHLQQIVVANVDQVLIVASWQEPSFWPELVDRYLIAVEVNQLQAVICINKIDLIEDKDEFQNALQPYHNLDLPIILTSAMTNEGIDELQTQLYERTTVLAGLSGVGKSTLLSAVQPDIILRTGDVGSSRKYKGMGRHTTSQATLLKLEKGGAVVDTPGIREFGLANVHKSELFNYFPEMSTLASGCRFRNCSHIHESECAVRQSVKAGDIFESRYKSYKNIYQTLSD